MKYLFETHAHTSESSPCSHVNAAKLVREYKDNGYDGIIITDHVGTWGFAAVRGTWKDKVDGLLFAYEAAKNAGDKEGVTVLFGMEIALDRPYQDYLVYGADAEFLYRNKDINRLDLSELYDIVKKENALLIAAHPFRGGGPPDYAYVDGAEVFNGNPRQDNRNDKALKWAKKHNLIQFAGSDFHEHGDVSVGLLLDDCPENMDEFVSLIKSGRYSLKI